MPPVRAMKKVYSWHDRLLVMHLRNVIENEGIVCEIRNELLASAAGELPPTECWPEIWVRTADADRALALIEETLAPGESQRRSWICPGCRERLEGQFAVCWNCATPRPEPEER